MVITICNFKGGVGKTTTCHALATAKGLQGSKVLCIDLDAQHSLSKSCDIQVNELETLTICELLIAELENYDYDINDVQESIIHLENMDIIPCNKTLSDITDQLTINQTFFALKNILDKIKSFYDYIFIDCSPTKNITIKNAILASDSVIVPVESYFLGSEGLYEFIETLDSLNEQFNTNVYIEGVILTMYQNTKICKTIRDYIKDSITTKNEQKIEIPQSLINKNIKVFDELVPRSIKVSEAGVYGKSIVEYQPSNPVAQAYCSIASQIGEKAVIR